MKSVSYGSALRLGIVGLVAAGALLSVSIVGAVAVSARGNPHAQSTNSSLTLVPLNSTDGLPHWGQQVTFNVSTTATTQPNVSLNCYQNGVLVYGAVAGFYPSYPWPWTQIFTLSSPSWTSGGANCTAALYYFSGTKTVTLTTMNIQVYG
jgi:hypothetical protein